MKTTSIKKGTLKALAKVAKPKKVDPNYPFECISFLHQPKRPSLK